MPPELETVSLYHPTPVASRLKEGQESVEMLQALISIHIAPYMRAAVKRHWLPNDYTILN
jgi:hypothetical protein